MQSYIVQESTLTEIADSVREQIGSTSPIPLDAIPEKIRTLTDTSDANAIATDLQAGKTAYVGGKKITGEKVTVKINATRSGTLHYHDGKSIVTVSLSTGTTTIEVPKNAVFIIFAATTRQGSYTTYYPTVTVTNGSRVVDQRTFSVASSSVTTYIFYYFITVKGNATVTLSKSTTLIRE